MMTRILVVGDAVLDQDCVGDLSMGLRAGGAALAAELVRSDGVDVCLATALADDDAGRLLIESINLDIKVLALGRREQTRSVIRAMTKEGTPISRTYQGREGFDRLSSVDVALLEPEIEACDAVLVSDYGGKLLSLPDIRAALQRWSHRRPIVWDPHRFGTTPLPNLNVITPNRDEALAFSSVTTSLREAAIALYDRWTPGVVVCTDGANGSVAVSSDKVPWRLTPPFVSVRDSCGAGDRFAATLAVGRARGSDVSVLLPRATHQAATWLEAGGVAKLTTWKEV